MSIWFKSYHTNHKVKTIILCGSQNSVVAKMHMFTDLFCQSLKDTASTVSSGAFMRYTHLIDSFLYSALLQNIYQDILQSAANDGRRRLHRERSAYTASSKPLSGFVAALQPANVQCTFCNRGKYINKNASQQLRCVFAARTSCWLGQRDLNPRSDRVKVCCLTAWLCPRFTLILYQKTHCKSIAYRLYFLF